MLEDHGCRYLSKQTMEKKTSISNNSSKTQYVCCFDTPVGRIFSMADEIYVYVLVFEGSSILDNKFPKICDRLGACRILEHKNKVLINLENELKAYFNGTLQKFTVPVKTVGTQFHQVVWAKLQELPYGTTITYKDLARLMGCPAKARAIGNACANNTLLLLIPCHRVVASSSRGGYNSGAERKEWLINHERMK